MKFFFSIMLSCTLLSSPFYEEQPLIQPASADLSESFYQMSVAKGEVAELSARQLEIRLGLEEGELLGITITALPDNGSLCLLYTSMAFPACWNVSFHSSPQSCGLPWFAYHCTA